MNNLKVIITGATGMIGKGVLLECLADERVTEILVVNRSSLGMDHPKLKEVLLQDLMKPETIQEQLRGYHMVFFCLGISAGGMKEEDYKRITYDYTLHFAKAYQAVNPQGSFIYISGTGTDSTEKGRMMWARVKGKTENDLLAMGFKNAYMFRPGMIQPLKGIQSRTDSYRTMYKLISPFWGIIKTLMGKNLTDTVRIGQAMINVSVNGSDKTYFENPDINELAAKKDW